MWLRTHWINNKTMKWIKIYPSIYAYTQTYKCLNVYAIHKHTQILYNVCNYYTRYEKTTKRTYSLPSTNKPILTIYAVSAQIPQSKRNPKTHWDDDDNNKNQTLNHPNLTTGQIQKFSTNKLWQNYNNITLFSLIDYFTISTTHPPFRNIHSIWCYNNTVGFHSHTYIKSCCLLEADRNTPQKQTNTSLLHCT